VTANVFNRHLTRKLCWIDSKATHASSARQRQCPLCRRKWSYDGLAKQWLLAQEYCAGHTRREAAEAAGVDVHTAGRHYAAFDKAVAGYVHRLLENGQSWILGDADRQQEVLSMGIRRPRSQRQRQRLAARVCFEKLPVRKRLNLIFQEVFAAKTERMKRNL
jgi:hypothetical protein